jgi:hypothetical protein
MSIEQDMLDEMRQMRRTLESNHLGRSNYSGRGGDSDSSARETLKRSLDQQASKAREKLEGLSSAASSSGSGLKELFLAFGASTSAIGILVTAIDHQVSSYNSLVKLGDTFGGSMLQMNMAAGQAGMGLGEFVKVMEKAGEGVRVLGGIKFAQMSRQVQDSNMNLRMMGLSTLEINEGLGEYIETVRLSGNMQRVTENQMVHNYAKLATGIGDLSKQTGKSRKDIEAAFKDLAKNDVVVGALAGMTQGMSDDIKMRMTTITSLLGKEGAAMAESFISTGSMFVKDGGKVSGLISSLAPGLSSAMEDFMSGRIDQKTFTQKLAASGQSMSSIQTQLSQLHTAGVDGAGGALEMMNKFAQINSKMEDDAKPMTRALQSLTQIFSKTWASLSEGFLKPFDKVFNDPRTIDAFETFGTSLQWIAEKLGLVIGYFATGLVQLMSLNIFGEGSFFSKASEEGLTFSEVFGKFGSIVAASIGIFGLFYAAVFKVLAPLVAFKEMLMPGKAGEAGGLANRFAAAKGSKGIFGKTKAFITGQYAEGATSTIPQNHASQQISNNMGQNGANAAQQAGNLKSTFANAAGTALQMIAFAGAIWIVSKAFQNFAELSWDGILKGIAGVATVAITFGTFAALGSVIGPGLAAIGTGLGAFGTAALPAIPILLSLGAAFAGFGLAMAGIGYLVSSVGGMVDSFGRLAQIDSERLSAAGTAIKMLGEAISDIGSGSIKSAIGNMFGGNMIESIERLSNSSFGINSLSSSVSWLAQSFKELQTIDITSIENATLSLEKMGSALEKVQKGPSISTILGNVIQRATDIAMPKNDEKVENPMTIVSENTSIMVTEIRKTNDILSNIKTNTDDMIFLRSVAQKLDELNRNIKFSGPSRPS